MKTLLLLRHAKSAWDDDSLADHDRPLNQRGKKAAPLMGALLREEKLLPNHIVSSTAVRALATALAVGKAARYEGAIEETRALYLAAPSAYFEVARQASDDIERLMLVGHNPGIEIALEQLTGTDEPMPTAALAVIAVPVERWRELGRDTACELVHFWKPKDLE